ncbi:unnamed protein product, partial [Meganyctiphanes norvegica]
MYQMWFNSAQTWKILLVALSCHSHVQGLGGSQVWHVSNDAAASLVSDFESAGLLDVLHQSQKNRSFHVHHEHQDRVRRSLSDFGINIDVLVEDWDKFLMMQEAESSRNVKADEETQTCNRTSCTAPLNDQYMSFKQMEWYLQYLSQTYTERVNISSIGKSVENRDIWLVHLRPEGCADNTTTHHVKSIWLEGGIHAREWISPAVCLHFIHNILHDCELTQHFDIYILPEVNPDGYEYSRLNRSTRLWRKNRSFNEDTKCYGVDLNRNWDFQFGVVGASASPCSNIYKGPSAFSEPETAALSTAMAKIPNLELYIALHSYSQLLMYPWGYTIDETAPDTDELRKKCEIFVNNLNARFDNNFSCENSAAGLYFVGGASDDWAKGVLGVKYAYTLELRDAGNFGFVLPEDQIIPSVQETWDGFQAMLKSMTESTSEAAAPSQLNPQLKHFLFVLPVLLLLLSH